MRYIQMDHHHVNGSELALGGMILSVFCFVVTQINNIPILTIKVQEIAGVAATFAGFASAAYYVQKFFHERTDRRRQRKINANDRKAA